MSNSNQAKKISIIIEDYAVSTLYAMNIATRMLNDNPDLSQVTVVREPRVGTLIKPIIVTIERTAVPGEYAEYFN